VEDDNWLNILKTKNHMLKESQDVCVDRSLQFQQ